MEIGDIGSWISENEALLSGLAALVVLAGLVLSPLGKGVRSISQRFRGGRAAPLAVDDVPHASTVKDQEAAGSPATTIQARADPILGVLPFDNLSNDPELQFFSDGVSEEIIQRLARGARLKVIGRTSSFQFRGDEKGDAAQRLNCSHVLDGSIRRAEGRVRVSASLIEASTQTVLWSDSYDRELRDIFAVQDDISENIASALDRAFAGFSSGAIDPADYDLYLRTSPTSFAPDELNRLVGMLEEVTRRAPKFAEGWGRLAYLRSFAHFYRPYSERPEIARQVEDEARRALALDPQCVDAMTGQLFVVPPFGRFLAADDIIERMSAGPSSGDGRRYVGWYLRTMGRVRESLEESEREYRLNPLDSMSANTVALARLAAGRIQEAVPVYEALIEREPGMSFPVSSLLRAQAFLGDWDAVNRLLALAEARQLREFQDTIPFIRAKREPSMENLGAWWREIEAHVEKTGGIDVARLVYSAHLGLVDQAYALAETARLGPDGSREDIMGPDAYRTSLLFQASMPELRNDRRFAHLCARLGLVEFWLASDKWPDCEETAPYDFQAECRRVQAVPKESFLV